MSGRALVPGLRRLRSGYRPPYEVAAAEPPERLTAALVRNLAEGVGGEVAYAVPAGRTHAVVESWPPHVAGVVDAVGVAQVDGGGSLFVVAPSRWDDGARAMLRDTAGWLGTAVRLERLRADRDAADLRARRLRAESGAVRTRLARVRDLERHRLVGAITTTTLRDLAVVRTLLRAVAEEDAGLQAAQEALEDLIDDFRVVVRGVFPAMLPDRGARAALEELAATLPCPVSFTGDLGPRVGWQLESGFYHAVASVLNLLAGKEHAVSVAFGRDDALRARVTATGPLTTEELRTALSHDIERVAVLGGEMTCGVADGTAVVTVRLAERIEPAAVTRVDPAGAERSAIYRQVRDLVRQGQAATDGLPERAGWDAVAERLAMPPRLAVVGADPGVVGRGAVTQGAAAQSRAELSAAAQGTGGQGPAELSAAELSAAAQSSAELGAAKQDPATQSPAELGVSVLMVDAPADRALAEEFLADDGPRGGVDAVLCQSAPTREFREALRAGRHRVALAEAGSSVALASALAARGPVIAARRAVRAMAGLVRALPGDHPLRWAVERVGVDAHEFAELDLLDDLDRSALLRGVASSAARLLGADGVDPRSRLGLPENAATAEITSTARAEVARWRAHAEHPATGGRDRAACEVLVRTAEGLLAP
ncbi:hypothetical protein [Saccharothrix sp. NRRL B-16348]|uniref:hypothetical protein n=1 Tax=Saccharothrix sp. NRRL B-16348 TaxID=1415542 RepID=UPI0006AEA866|nr:hypothetical protein [Saccharothrix sp. NRRL B-16348]